MKYAEDSRAAGAAVESVSLTSDELSHSGCAGPGSLSPRCDRMSSVREAGEMNCDELLLAADALRVALDYRVIEYRARPSDETRTALDRAASRYFDNFLRRQVAECMEMQS